MGGGSIGNLLLDLKLESPAHVCCLLPHLVIFYASLANSIHYHSFVPSFDVFDANFSVHTQCKISRKPLKISVKEKKSKTFYGNGKIFWFRSLNNLQGSFKDVIR